MVGGSNAQLINKNPLCAFAKRIRTRATVDTYAFFYWRYTKDTMNIATIILLASLLCAECPACDIDERWLIAQTVVYRAEAKDLPIDKIIYEPRQYQAAILIDIEAYRTLRCKEFEENIAIAQAAILIGPVVNVSNFAKPGSADWQKRCEIKYIERKHRFYLCSDWRR